MFVSSTFLDTFDERDHIMQVGCNYLASRMTALILSVFQHATASIRNWAREFCLDFELVDMRWGLPLKTSTSTQIVSTCIQELQVRGWKQRGIFLRTDSF